MNPLPIGYDHLVRHYGLAARPLTVRAEVDTRARARASRMNDGEEILVFQPSYQPEDTLTGHLQFALRYEGVNLEVLALLFQQTGRDELTAWLHKQPRSTYARRAGFFYEWLTGTTLDVAVPSKAALARALDPELQLARPKGERNARYRVIDNLPGTPQFCPLIRRTPYIASMLAKDLHQRTQERLAKYDPQLLARAAAFLYLKETHNSFDIERAKPSPARAQRFADLLRNADQDIDLSEDKLVDLQNAVVDPRFAEAGFRNKQNWVGKDLGYRRRVAFVPPRPEDVRPLMQGLARMAAQTDDADVRMDPVALAAAVAFGFVFIHPFIDGNGRLHRYLIHQVLSVSGFTPRGIILPVSAVILANIDRYNEALEHFSAPMVARTQYNPDTPDVPAEGNDALYFRFFDATEQAAFLFWALDRTIEEDLEKEVNYLLGYDLAFRRLNERFDWPGHRLDTFINVVAQNNWRLSNGKRKAYFEQLTDDEVAQFEAVVREAYAEVAADP
ncbi:MAG: Fic family protein [Casimicrobiaceae bacterium]